MTPSELAELHSRAFYPERGWNEAEFGELLKQKTTELFVAEQGFALIRCVADETELLTLAVAPTARRQGVANALMQEWLSMSTARDAFLEVAEDNTAALALYQKWGFAICGRRKGYYRRRSGTSCDAVLMQVSLTNGQSANSHGLRPKTG